MSSESPLRNPPFRAEHVGSLLRPQELVQMRYDVAAGKATQAQLAELEDKAVKQIVIVQQDCGIHSISDGEYRRQFFWGRFFETLNGFEEKQTAAMEGYDASWFRQYAPDVKSFLHAKQIPNAVTICTGNISHTGRSDYLRELQSLQSLVPKERWGDIKITLAAPSWYHFRYAQGRAYGDVYPNDEAYFEDLAKAYRQELRILYDAGLRNVQVDDPSLAYFCDESMLKGWAEDKTNEKSADEMFEFYIRAYNKCFDRPADMRLAIHLCRGNYIGSKHFSTGAYDRIAEKLFRKLNVNTFYLEYDDDRSGGFEPLQHLPLDKNVVIGAITSKHAQLEDKEAVIARIHQAADFVAKGSNQTREEALKRLSVSPQCGFASHAEGNAIDHAGMVAKLKLVREVADAVWPGEP